MVRAPKLSLHERGQIKALSTTGYTMKQIANIFERSRKIIMNFLRLPEEYGINKSSRRLGKNFAGGSVMVWGAFNAIGLVDLTKMKSTDYQDVSGHYLVPYLQQFPSFSFTFQQECHYPRQKKH
uniref:HTH_Tnp_Tc3_1 domain-containing protein n=1 Tax=Heterorhabditis bacteriophora TaxID=37862 RepID=A0A1I7WUS5_HETBA